MNRNGIIFIGVGNSGCNAVNKLYNEGFRAIAIHDGFEIDEEELSCPQINLFDNHSLPEDLHFTQNKENVEKLVEEIKPLIQNLLKK